MERQILDVSQVNEYIKGLMDTDELLTGLCIRGELSNYKIYPSGHHYFTLKDAGGALRCVMFRSSAAHLRFRPENGMKVLAMGRITVFPRDGAYQLYCNDLTPDGVGDLYVAFEQLKAKLSAEGLFDARYKKPLPPFPHRIAIITSGAGAAIMDMLRILGKRYPLSKVVILPVRVQGQEAPAEIAGAIRYANKYQVADVIITYLLTAQKRMAQAMQKQIKLERKTLDGLKNRRVLQSPINYVNEKRLLLDHSAQRLGAAMQRNQEAQKRRFIHLTAKLDALSPLKVLARGYSVVLTEDGRVVQRAEQVSVGQQVTVKLSEGSITASVLGTQEERHG